MERFTGGSWMVHGGSWMVHGRSVSGPRVVQGRTVQPAVAAALSRATRSASQVRGQVTQASSGRSV